MAAYLFIIGANSKSLRFAEDDAKAIAASFSNVNYKIHTVDPELSAAEIISTLRESLESCLPQDKFLFYFVGHGIKESGKLFLSVNSSKADKISSYINISDVIASFATCKCNEKLIVLDCCHSGIVVNEHYKQAKNLEIIAAAEAFEKVPELDEFRSGFLAHHIKIAFSGADYKIANADGIVSASSLVNWLSGKIAQHNVNSEFKMPRLIKLTSSNNQEFFFFRMKELAIQIDPDLLMQLELYKETCKARNIPYYSAFIYLALLQMPGSFAVSCFDKISDGLSNSILSFFQRFEEKTFAAPDPLKSFQDFSWQDRPEIMAARSFANEVSSNIIGQQHLFVGILSTLTNSTLQLRKTLGSNFDLLIEVAKNHEKMNTFF